ncbi:hypothetical protein QYB59_002439 [Clostridium perfringens]|nr:hypothetical protein [Clostridium perfringens]
MKKKLIIAAIIGVILVGGTTVVVALNNNYSKDKQESISENEKATNNEDQENKEVVNQEEKSEVEQEDSNKEEKVEESKANINEEIKQEVKAENPKEQTLDEGYQIYYKARDAYNREDFDEAIRLYETITNKDALAKVQYEKDRFYLAKQVNDQIKEGQKLYDSGKYLEAKIFISKLTRGNAMLPNQEARANEIYEKASSRVTPDEEKQVNGNFTFEQAVELVKKEIGDNPNNTYENFQEYTDIHGAKVYQVIVKKNGDMNNSELYVVGSDGSVISGS